MPILWIVCYGWIIAEKSCFIEAAIDKDSAEKPRRFPQWCKATIERLFCTLIISCV